jgi:hypothetical protein
VSEQGDAFVRHVLHGDPTPSTFTRDVQYLRQRGGSGRAAARLAGVNESTLRRWARGSTPKQGTAQRIAATVRELRSRPSRLGDKGVLVTVTSHERKRADRTRAISGAQMKLKPGTLERAHNIWVSTGDADAAARAFVAGIGDPWYRANLGRSLTPRGGSTGAAGGGGASGGGATGGGPTGGGTGSGDDLDLDGDYFDDYGMSFG